MISNYNLDCGYHNFELKDKIYLVPDYALKVIYTDGFNEVVFQGDSSNVTLLEGHEITFQEETSFDERFKFSKVLSLKVNGYKTFNDLDYRYYAIIETKDSEFYLVNVDFPSFVTHTYTLNANTNETELVFSSQSNIATLKLTNFEPNNVNSCNEYSTPKVKKFKLTESWASSLSTWQKSLVNKGEFVDIEPLPDSISLTEEFDGEKYTVTLGFDIPMSYYKNDWHIKLLQFEENKYRGYIELEDGNVAFVGYNVGLFPSYTINGDIISIRLTETAIRGIAYGNDYVLIDTDIPNTIEYNGASCYTYNWLSTCDWHVEDKPDYITITPTSGQADTQYELEICNTDAQYGHEASEFIIKSCRANARGTIVVNNPMFRYTATTDVMCVDCTKDERWVDSGTTCVGHNKCSLSVKQERYPCEANEWVDVDSATTLIERYSYDCGYDPQYDYLTLELANENVSNPYITVTHDYTSTASTKVIYYKKESISGSTDWLEYTIKPAIYDDFGNPWTPNPNHLSFNPGEVVKFKCNLSNGYLLHFKMYNGDLGGDVPYFNIIGNPASLNVGDSVTTGVTHQNRDFSGWFNYSTVKSFKKMYFDGGGRYAYTFQGCDYLTEIPELPIPTRAYAYEGMFANITTLTTAPILSATTLVEGCYQRMFSGCTSLSSVTCLATSVSTNSTREWLTSVSATGVFYKNPNMNNWSRCPETTWYSCDGIPYGWEIIDYQI